MMRVLESSTSQYRGLAWRPKSTDLAVLRTNVDKAFKDTAHVFIAWTNAASPEPTAQRLDPASAERRGIPGRHAHRRLSPADVVARRTHDLLRHAKREPVADAIKKSEEKVSDVEIWHTNDVRMLPQQKNQENQDLRATLLTAWRIADNKVVPIGTDLNEPATVLEGGRYATEIDRKPYAWGWKFGRNDEDVYVVDLGTGERKKMLEKVRHYFGADPAGTKLAWSDGKDFWIVDIPSGKQTNLTAKLTSNKKADFVDHDDDHPNNVAPVINPAGWTKGGDGVFRERTYDVWQLKLDGSGGTRLTDGAKDGVMHRLVNFARIHRDARRASVRSVEARLLLAARQEDKTERLRANATSRAES